MMFPLCLLLAAIAVQSGPQAPRERAVFSARSELVALHVTVTDPRSGFVAGLPREAFTIYEDGQPQRITFFENADIPVTVGLVLDNSASMQRTRDSIIEAAMTFARQSHPDDEMFTVHFNERVWSGLPPQTPFTSERTMLHQSLLRSTARGQTALFDAVLAGLEHLSDGQRQKKVLVLFSDGGDNASRAKVGDVLNAALSMNALIYSVSLYDQYARDANPRLLRRLAESTGAVAFFARQSAELPGILGRIAREIRSGYTIGYVPAGSSNREGYHSIRVEVRSPYHRKLAVRARSGYVAGTSGDGTDAR